MNNKVKKVGLNILGLVLFISAVLGLVSATEAESSGKVEKIIVDIKPLEGNILLIGNEDLARLIKKNYDLKLKGQEISLLDLGKLESIIEKNEFVRDAQVYIDARNNLKIRVIQNNPILRVISPGQINFLITDQGEKIPMPDHAVMRLPVLTGSLPSFTSKTMKDSNDVYFKGYSIAMAMRKNPFANSLTEQLVADENKDIIMIPKLGSHKIILGDAENLENKFKRLEVFYKKAMPAEGWNLYKEINLKYKDQVIARKAETTPIKS